jgi:hypothetical protein
VRSSAKMLPLLVLLILCSMWMLQAR